MHFNHLGLPVRDERRSQRFYSAYFGFDPATAQQYPDGTVIIRNADGFDLALHPVEHIEPPPVFLHCGFKAAGPADVRTLMDRMEADGMARAYSGRAGISLRNCATAMLAIPWPQDARSIQQVISVRPSMTKLAMLLGQGAA
jgi:hypothetical protein